MRCLSLRKQAREFTPFTPECVVDILWQRVCRDHRCACSGLGCIFSVQARARI